MLTIEGAVQPRASGVEKNHRSLYDNVTMFGGILGTLERNENEIKYYSFNCELHMGHCTYVPL